MTVLGTPSHNAVAERMNHTIMEKIRSMVSHVFDISLLAVLRGRKEAIGWNLSNLKGIDPSLCTHRIFLEEDSRPSKEAQRRLNPKVWDAINNEILKWLNGGILYLISDSLWVSPVHVVPKKAGITVMRNDKGEELQTCLLTKW